MCPPWEQMPSDKPPCMQLSEPTTFLSAHTRDGLGHEQMLDNRRVLLWVAERVVVHNKEYFWTELLLNSLSRVRLFATPRTVARQAPLSMGFSRQEYWSGLPFPSPGDLPNPGIEPGSPALQADALSS